MWYANSVQFIAAAHLQISSAIIDKWNTGEESRRIAAIAAELSQRIWITWRLDSTIINKANHIVRRSNVLIEYDIVFVGGQRFLEKVPSRFGNPTL